MEGPRIRTLEGWDWRTSKGPRLLKILWQFFWQSLNSHRTKQRLRLLVEGWVSGLDLRTLEGRDVGADERSCLFP